MSLRFMRVMVFFDLPTITEKNRAEYRKFHKFLIQEGFIMMQESVYTKLALNGTVAELIRKKVRKNKPPDRKSTRLNSSHNRESRMPSSA